MIVSGLQPFIPMDTKGFKGLVAVRKIVSVMQVVSQKGFAADLHDEKLNEAINSVKQKRKASSLIILVCIGQK